MKVSDFGQNAPGDLVPTVNGAVAFVPDPIPEDIPLESSTVRLLARAERAVGRLGGLAAGKEFNPYLVGSPFLKREAILSSKMEGTITTPEQLALLEAETSVSSKPRIADDNTQEVNNYIAAMRRGIARVNNGDPIRLELLQDIHRVLLTGVRGERERPGEFRRSQNWIRGSDDTIGNARFVPPPVPQMNEALGGLERYLNHEQTDDRDPLLVQLALIHYQFETIHPFRDGNGRVGRLMIPLLMCSHGRLDSPMLYLSPFFEGERRNYVDLMLRVSQTGDWRSWIEFFLRGVLKSADDAISGAYAIMEKRQEYHARFQKEGASTRLLAIIDLLFQNPAIAINYAAREIGVSHQVAAYNIHKLEEAGLLQEVTGRKRNKIYLAEEIADFLFQRPGGD